MRSAETKGLGRMGGWGIFALGVAAALAARAVSPVIARKARPLAREAVKQAILLSNGARVRAEGLREDWEDLVAEAREELSPQEGQPTV